MPLVPPVTTTARPAMEVNIRESSRVAGAAGLRPAKQFFTEALSWSGCGLREWTSPGLVRYGSRSVRFDEVNSIFRY
jgi:hypothetical protein